MKTLSPFLYGFILLLLFGNAFAQNNIGTNFLTPNSSLGGTLLPSSSENFSPYDPNAQPIASPSFSAENPYDVDLLDTTPKDYGAVSTANDQMTSHELDNLLGEKDYGAESSAVKTISPYESSIREASGNAVTEEEKSAVIKDQKRVQKENQEQSIEDKTKINEAQKEKNTTALEKLEADRDAFAEEILKKEAEEEAKQKALEAKRKGFTLKDAVGYTFKKKTETPAHLVISENSKESSSKSFTDILQNIIKGLIGISAGVAIFFIVFNAGKLIFALGSSDEISQAKNGLMGAGGGLILIMFAYLIAKTIISISFLGQV